MGGGYVDFYKITTSGLPRKLDEFYKAFNVAFRSRNYDVVYISIGHCVPFCGLMRQIGIMKAKLVVVAHHPPFKMLKYGKYDAIMFFSESLRKMAIELYPKIASIAYVNEWGPDLSWYKKHDKSMQKGGLFIENGKSNRDFDLLNEASSQLQVDVFNYESFKNELNNNVESDIDAIKRTNGYKYVVIAVKERSQKKDVVCGLTSYMDALGLCKPILVSDNVSFASDVISNHLGVCYETGSLESICLMMQTLIANQSIYGEYQEMIKNYVSKVNMMTYSKKLLSIFNEIGVI